MNQNEYVRLSLELNLFFDRIMKEHSLFLEAAFMPIDSQMKVMANSFQKTFSNILEEVISIADGRVDSEFLRAEEIVTKNTLNAESQTSNLSGIRINTDITMRELNLRSGRLEVNEQIIRAVSQVNRKTMPIVERLIEFKQSTLNEVLSCKKYTANYPLLITHIMNEAKMFLNLLRKLESREPFSTNYIYEQELFWNVIMKEHAEFIRGLLDPTEKDLIKTSNMYAENYENIINEYRKDPKLLTSMSLQQTIDFQKFKLAGEEGILNCKIKSIIIPLLADHVLREANHFIRILKSAS